MSILLTALVAAVGLAVLFVVVWLLIMLYVKATSRHGAVSRFLEPSDDEMSPEERIKSVSNHPGAGGFG